MAEDNFNYIVRVANADLDGKKKIVDALRKIKGINFMLANAVCASAGVEKGQITGNLAENDVGKLSAVIHDPVGAGIPTWMLNRRQDYETGESKHLIVNDLIFARDSDVKRLRKIKSYRGSRHAAGLPSRGQRTQSNFRRNKGKKR